MLRRLIAASFALGLGAMVVAAPIKSGPETVTDRAGFIPNRKHQSLGGKVVGVLIPDPLPVLSTEGRSGPKDQLCFARGMFSYRWIYVPVEKNAFIGTLNIRIGEKGSQVKQFDKLSMANPETVKQWDVPATFALVEVEVNEGLGSPPDDGFVATKMRRLDGTAEFPFKLGEVISDLRRKYDDHAREQARSVDEAMVRVSLDAIKDRKATGPRERNDVMFVTWMPDAERLRVHFRTSISDGEYQYANGIKIDVGRTTAPAFRPTSLSSRLPEGLRYGKQFGVEYGMAFEVSKSGKIEKTAVLPLETFQKTIQQPRVFGSDPVPTRRAAIPPNR
jgi:hypothetical protein